MSIKNSNTCHALYNEASALQEMLVATEELFADCCLYLDKGENYDADILIVIGGKSFAFYTGGVQAAALHAFIQSIADENGYEVNYDKLTVEA